MKPYQRQFIEFALSKQVLKFGWRSIMTLTCRTALTAKRQKTTVKAAIWLVARYKDA